jgi:cytochrome P450
MALHPEVVRKAQAEIDAVVGNDRLPTFSDREQLPYLDALVKEVLRWNAVVPTGTRCSFLACRKYNQFTLQLPAVPHRAIQDDVHEGFLIPKGSLVIPNIWSVSLKKFLGAAD